MLIIVRVSLHPWRLTCLQGSTQSSKTFVSRKLRRNPGSRAQVGPASSFAWHPDVFDATPLAVHEEEAFVVDKTNFLEADVPANAQDTYSQSYEGRYVRNGNLGVWTTVYLGFFGVMI